MICSNQDDYSVKRMKRWFKDTFHDAYIKNFLLRFPFDKVKHLINKSRKHQKDFSQMEECLEQNLGLSNSRI